MSQPIVPEGMKRAKERRAARDASGVMYVDGSIYEGMEACLVRFGRTVAHVVKYADAVEIAAAMAGRCGDAGDFCAACSLPAHELTQEPGCGGPLAYTPTPPADAGDGGGKCHHIKCWPDVFEEMRAGRKTAEFRYNDRDYQVGDTLLIREWDTATAAYTHREITRAITHVLQGGFGVPAGYAMLSLATPPMQAAGVERATIVQIIDPETVRLIDHYCARHLAAGLSREEAEAKVFKGYPQLQEDRVAAEKKADAMLAALTPPSGVEEWRMVQRLRDEEADSVTILCDNPDGPPNNAVECCGFWTGFAERRFEGATIAEALANAVSAKHEAAKAGYPDVATPPTVEQAVAAEREALAWFSGQHRLSLQYYSPWFGDDDDQRQEWRVDRESGPINDREWETVGRGATAFEAIAAAMSVIRDRAA